MTALDAAVRLSGIVCRHNKPDDERRGCKCAEPAVILLEADCSVPQDRLPYLLENSSHHCKFLYASHMKNRRERLVQFALDNLAKTDAEHLGLPGEGAPDTLAWRTVQFLERRGIRVPDALALGSSRYTPIFEIVTRPNDADMFFQLGFRDIPESVTRDPVFWRDAHLDYTRWLSDHGIDPILTKLSPGGSGRTLFSGHMVMLNLGWDPQLGADWLRSFIVSALATGPDEIAHRCRCGCLSEAGSCTPLTYLLKGMTTQPGEVLSPALAFARHLEWYALDFTVEQHVVVLRYLTFTGLGLPHTCCNPMARSVEEFWPKQSAEEVDEIEDEHAFELAMLEQLVGELGGQLRGLLQDPKSRIADIADFYGRSFVRKMQEVQAHLAGNRLSEAERTAAEDIGVVWDDLRKPAQDLDMGDEDPPDLMDLEFWINRLQEIEDR